MTLETFRFAEPLIASMVKLLETKLPKVIEEQNATITDGFTVEQPVNYLPYLPFAATLELGMPLIAVQRLGADFTGPDSADLQSAVWARHEYAVFTVIQNADHLTLAKQLGRTLQCVMVTIQNDRLAGNPVGTASVMKTEGGAWSVNFVRSDPGPLLGDLDLLNPGNPPQTYLSWTALVLSSEHEEV